MTLPNEEIKRRLHAVRVRQKMLRCIATIMADQLGLRLNGLQAAHPISGQKVVEWAMRLKVARLQQDKDLIREIEWDYQEYLRAQDWEEFWYREDREGAEMISRRYDSIASTRQ